MIYLQYMLATLLADIDIPSIRPNFDNLVSQKGWSLIAVLLAILFMAAVWYFFISLGKILLHMANRRHESDMSTTVGLLIASLVVGAVCVMGTDVPEELINIIV